jgi:hypothetical protein
LDKRQGVSRQVFEVLRQPAASSKPREGPLDDPSARDDFEALRLIGALNDLGDQERQNLLLRRPEFWSLIATVGEELAQKRVQSEQRRQHQLAAVAILNISGMHNRVQQQAYRIDEDMALLALDLFPRIVAVRIDASPPFSALLTL